MCTCDGKPVRYLICKRNAILAASDDEQEAMLAAKRLRGFVCVDVTSKSDTHTSVSLIRPKGLGLANSSRHPASIQESN